nr:tryptophan synthase subunit alpha [bacterium]
MNKSPLADVFSQKAFIPFITAGDPDLETTMALIPAIADAGADLIEIGIPFSDPIAEGPVIEAADGRALAAGATTDKIFDALEHVRWRRRVPLAVMTYFNPVFTYGIDRFLARCAQAGVCALIVPDVPFEEKAELEGPCRAHGIALISMIAPTSQARIAAIAGGAEGFLYCVSSMGVTGMRKQFSAQLTDMIAAAKAANDIPCAVGFGVSTPQQAAELAPICDGVIVGSAVVDIIARHGKACIGPVTDYVRQMKTAILGGDTPCLKPS